jgi:hypothetical protein
MVVKPDSMHHLHLHHLQMQGLEQEWLKLLESVTSELPEIALSPVPPKITGPSEVVRALGPTGPSERHN